MSKLYSHPCLFCGDEYRDRTDEHVLQRGFGSNWTLPKDVCTTCNTEIFSPLDKALIEFAHEFVYASDPDVSTSRGLLQAGQSLIYDKDSGAWLSVRVDQRGYLIVLPQIVLLENGNIHIQLDSQSKTQPDLQFEQIRQELKNPAQLKLTQRLSARCDEFKHRSSFAPPVQPALIRSAKNTYCLQASSSEGIEELRQFLFSGALDGVLSTAPAPVRSQKALPMVEQNIVMNLENINRALAKSALNAVCACIGPDRARDPSLNPLRDFAFGKALPGSEFVTHLWGSRPPNPAYMLSQRLSVFSKADHHTVLIAPFGDIAVATFHLYGKPFALVELAKNSNLLFQSEITAALINYKTKTHQLYNLLEEPVAFQQAFPTAAFH